MVPVFSVIRKNQRFGVLVVADRVADLEPFDAHDGANLAARHFVDLLFAETFEDHQVFDPGLLHRCTVALGQRDVLSRPERAARHLAARRAAT